MQPLDLLKVKLQVTTVKPTSGLGKHIWTSFKNIQQTQGWRGLYRGLIPNIAGNASSWGLYFLLCVFLLHSVFASTHKPLVIICWRNVPRTGISTKPCQLLNIFYVQPKPVRISSFTYKCAHNVFAKKTRFYSGAVTAVITNPLWLVRVRMFANPANCPNSYRGLWSASVHSRTNWRICVIYIHFQMV